MVLKNRIVDSCSGFFVGLHARAGEKDKNKDVFPQDEVFLDGRMEVGIKC